MYFDTLKVRVLSFAFVDNYNWGVAHYFIKLL